MICCSRSIFLERAAARGADLRGRLSVLEGLHMGALGFDGDPGIIAHLS
jgi:hypothetical protein